MKDAPPDHYAILGVDAKATLEEVKVAYRNGLIEARHTHDDTQPLKKAFAVLSNTGERSQYDRELQMATLVESKPSVRRRNMLQDLDLDEENLSTTHEQIKRGIKKNRLKMLDIFQQVDEDASGQIQVAELSRGFAEMGLKVPKRAMAQIFKSFDKDGSGWVSYEEFRDTLRSDEMLSVEELSDEERIAMGIPLRPIEAEAPAPAEPERRSALGNWRQGSSVARAFGGALASSVRLQPLPFRAVSVGRGADSFDAWELIHDAHMNNRGSTQLAIVTHPLQAGAQGDGDTIDDCVRQRPLHHALYRGGWSVLAYEACRLADDGPGDTEAARLRSTMDYVAAHRKLRYCKCVLVTQGTGASAAFKALHDHPESFEYVVRAISACQPSGADELQEAVIGEYAPQCSLPVMLSHAPVPPPSAGSLRRGLRPVTPHTIKVGRAFPEGTPKQTVEVFNYPVYGRKKRFEGTRYFGDHPNRLMNFLDEHAKAPCPSRTTPLRTSASEPDMRMSIVGRLGAKSSLSTAISAARLAVRSSGAALPEE